MRHTDDPPGRLRRPDRIVLNLAETSECASADTRRSWQLEWVPWHDEGPFRMLLARQRSPRAATHFKGDRGPLRTSSS